MCEGVTLELFVIIILGAGYYGLFRTGKDSKDGLLLDEADGGDLQSYIESDNNNEIDNSLRRKWSLQISEAVAYAHSKGIVHSNLSAWNVLVHETNLCLVDFGGSRCCELGVDGNLLPDAPFGDPQLTNFESPEFDVFCLGVVLYIINIGHYPFHERPAPQNEERLAYENQVQNRYEQGEFPDLSDVQLGDVIAGCCIQRRFKAGEDVVVALKAERDVQPDNPKLWYFWLMERGSVVCVTFLVLALAWAVTST
ncbi:kinase-like domain-containing protein [Phaeosphaeriaceae sp. PMI808]|nr:kinase-like domain-containing protein [Phaeosphaeriaceae sp. PMI808]